MAGDFGQSTDDEADARFGIDSLRAYLGSAEFLTETPDRLFYGPACWMFSAGAGVDLSQPAVHRVSIAGVGLAEVRLGDKSMPGSGSP